MENKLLSRQEVPVELTWDLSQIYRTEEDCLKDVERIKELGRHIEETYIGKLKDAKTVASCITEYRRLSELQTPVWYYSDLAVSVDYYNSHNQELNSKIVRIISDIDSRLSFIKSELMELDENIIKEAIEYDKANEGYLKNILKEKAHKLPAEAEKVLAAISPVLNVPYEIYNTAKLADMKFDSFTVNGKTYPLGYSLFEDNYEYEVDTQVRRTAFDNFSKKIKQYENTTAAVYNAQVQKEKIMADLRGYDSVFDSLLDGQNVSRELYDRQIDIITEKLAPHMRKYAQLIKKIYNLDEMTFADLKLPLDPEYDPKVTIEGSKEYIEKGLAILGEDYVKMIQTAYKDRWVDFAKNQGKSTGGFCASPYNGHSYILMSWNGKMSDVFTLAHELGHAGHFRLCNGCQSIFDTDVSSYFVESPSTMNELIMAHYLLKTSDDKRFRRWVLASMISNTYYHNFVTHLMEAAYQREVYKIVDNGGSVSAKVLSEIMKDTLSRFWGDSVVLNDGAELTWMRQPHYYMGLYSYTYSAGLTIATEVCKRIETEGEAAIEDWKRVLAAGSTKTPVELAKMAGVDITTDAPLLDTIDTIGSIIDEICKLTEEL